ncbi:FtsX-like permease family protein [Candidatus Sumerlaeota bacterium]|nr:FtsX-like permease family protein [Candidatus Sumerlaeota bacterium]
MAVILCGIADYVCVSSAYRNLKLTRDAFYRDYRLADFWIPLERAPKSAVSKIEAIGGVESARPRIVKDVNLDVAGSNEPKIGRIVSMPDRPQPVINNICLASGRYFSADALDEVILSDRFARANKLRPGDRIRATINTRKETLRIVGTALSPEYVYTIRNTQEFIPSDRGFAILFVKQTFAEMSLDMRDACNEIVGTAGDPKQLDEIFERAREILEPYGVLATIKQSDQISNRFISDEIANLGVAATIDPTIFLGVAAIILTLMLNRMVRRERTEIGMFKAYGYTDAAIMAHYVKFALAVALAGWAGGVALGHWLARWLMRMYQQFYHFPVLHHRFYGDVLAISLTIATVFAVAGAMGAVVRVLRISPAQPMRPEAPRLGGAIMLERIGWLWSLMTFSWKMILRNVSRFKVRAGVTIFGVALATAILMVGRFIMDSVDKMIQHQLHDAQREDVKVTFAGERGEGALGDLRRMDHVRRVEPLFEYPFELRSAWRKKELLVTGLRPKTQMFRLLDAEGRGVELAGDELILTERTAREMGVRAGDRVVLKPMVGKIRKERLVTVGRPINQYLGINAYMNLDALSRLMNEELAVNAALIRVERGAERLLSRDLKDVPAVTAVEIKQDALVALEETLKSSMAIMNAFLLAFAGVIAFAIIYNSASITIAERSRELATLKVMGFGPDEVGRIVFRENWLLSVVGATVGVPLGLALCRWLISFYDTDLYRLPFHVRNRTYVLTLLSIALFVAVANWSSRWRLKRRDMVEALKTRE